MGAPSSTSMDEPFVTVPATRKELIERIASHFHDTWRAPRWQEGEQRFDPRPKPTKDAAWIEAHGGATEVDIANTDYVHLPADWQEENRASAEDVVHMIANALVGALNGRIAIDQIFIDTVASRNHDLWVERNKSWADPALLVPFDQLPKEEQDKDRDVVTTGIRAFTAYESQLAITDR